MTKEGRIKKYLDIINEHPQYEDPQSHNSIREIDGIIYVLGNICGLAIYKADDYDDHYIAILLGEDDDYWFVREGICRFDIHWLPDYENVMKKAKEYLSTNYNIDFSND